MLLDRLIIILNFVSVTFIQSGLNLTKELVYLCSNIQTPKFCKTLQVRIELLTGEPFLPYLFSMNVLKQ